MEARLLSRIHCAARCVLAFIFIYHGLVPKILWLSTIEAELAGAHSVDAALLSPLAGTGEILLGLSLLVCRKTAVPAYAAMGILVVLLVDVALVKPGLLIEAFNPVTINLASIFIAGLIVVTQEHDARRRDWETTSSRM